MTEITKFEIDAERQSVILQRSRDLYRHCTSLKKWTQAYRPHICPFEVLCGLVPHGANVLDIGCGSGLFLGLLAAADKTIAGVGFDASEAAIHLADSMKSRLEDDVGRRLEFQHVDIRDQWPQGDFDFVSLVDVMHHCPVSSQERLLKEAASRVPDEGWLLYKDMSPKPLWCGLANRLHDLVMARDWIHYCPIDKVVEWGTQAGLNVHSAGRCRMFWYSHEYVLFQNSTDGNS